MTFIGKQSFSLIKIFPFSLLMDQVKVLKPPVKSQADKKEYRLIELPNGLKAFLISKPEEKSDDGSGSEALAAANLTVGVGSFSEKPEIGGLAHLLEHILFMGSEKYPEDSGYNNFISSHGGSNNAMTENEFTTYYFDVSENAFPEALDRFSQQFIAPLLQKEALQREREAVDSEFQMALSLDQQRIASFFKSLVKDSHPASFFDYGNLTTLKDEVSDDKLYEEIQELFKKYVANNMFLSLQSNRSLDDLQQLVLNNFSAIKSGEVVKREHQEVDEIFKEDFYNKIYFVKPIKDSKMLYMSWYLDSVDSHYKCRPLQYLEEVFKSQGEGGLSNYLREKQLAVSAKLKVDSQAFDSNSMFALVKIEVQLTELGFIHITKVLQSIFSYLLMLKETPIEEHQRLYNELQEKSETDFKFHKENDPLDNVLLGAWGLKYFEHEDILRGHTVFQGFCGEIITKIVDAMNERKFNLIILSDEHKSFSKHVKYFEVEYDDQDFPENYKELWDDRKLNPDFFMEKVNPFKATNFEIFVNDEESPVSQSKLSLVDEKYKRIKPCRFTR